MRNRLDLRPPAVAGLFYAGNEAELRSQIERAFLHPLGPGSLPDAQSGDPSALGLLSPHAGYPYSGHVAAHGYRQIAGMRPELVVIIGPNHRAVGSPIAISGSRAWETPLGEIETDLEMVDAIASLCPLARIDNRAHAMEHSVEVQVPFLQYLFGNSTRLVAILMSSQTWEESKALGDALAAVLRLRSGLLIASSDLTHYEAHESAALLDRAALDAVLSLDAQRLDSIVNDQWLTICGAGPIMAMIEGCKQLGATNARLLSYATSGQVSGDYKRVVGYASLLIT